MARIASPLTVRGFVVLTGRVAATLALDSRVPLLRPGKIVHSVGEAVIVLGLVAIVLATAETIATTWVLFRPRTSSAFSRPGPWVLGASVLLPAAVASVVALTSSAQASIDRLRSEFAPKVAEQTARRRLALVVSVRDAARSARAR